MTLLTLISELNKIALTHPNVRTAGEGNIYDTMNANPSIKYGVFFQTQGTHTDDEAWDRYNLTLFYIDRLQSNLENNRLQIQSIGKEVLRNIILTFCNKFDIEYPTVSYVTFTQQFADECAGAYAQIQLEIPKDITCEEDYIYG